jgi:PAS domain-containing protein
MSKAAAHPPVNHQEESIIPEHCREIFLFNEIATITAHTLDLQEIADLALDKVLEFFKIEAGLLLLWDHDHQRLTSVAARGFQVDYVDRTGAGELEKIIGPYLSRATQPLIIQDIRSDQRLATSTFSETIRHDPRFQAVVSIPLKYREEVNGFLNLAATDPEAFHPYKIYFYSILGNQIGLAIANARLYHHLRRSERRYRRIFEGSLDMIFVTDPTGQILDLNPAGLALLGMPSGKRPLFFPIFGKFSRTPGTGRLSDPHGPGGLCPGSGGGPQTEGRRPGPVLLTAVVRRDREGCIGGYEGIVKDITERKRGNSRSSGRKRPPRASWKGCPYPPLSSTATIAFFTGTGPARNSPATPGKKWWAATATGCRSIPMKALHGLPGGGAKLSRPWKPFSGPRT